MMKNKKNTDSKKESATKKDADTQIAYLPLYMGIGMSVGVAIGAATDNMPICMSLGVGIGACVGAALDSLNRKKEAEQSKSEDDEEPKS